MAGLCGDIFTMNGQTGKRNLITDVAGIKVGNADDATLLSGVTVILPENGAVAAVDVRGGAPGTRETEALDPSRLVDELHALVLTGGSVFGLGAADAVTGWLAARGIGFRFHDQPHPCPVVPAAVLFDLTNGGDKAWGETPPYRQLGIAACEAAGVDFALGNAGAGMGAIAGTLKGGLGSVSAVYDGVTIGALAAVNSFGAVIVPGSDVLWAAPYAVGEEFPSPPLPRVDATLALSTGTKADLASGAANSGQNTTLCAIATDAKLTPAQAQRLAIMAADGMARAIRPIHTPFDGDVTFALATGASGIAPDTIGLSALGTIAADCTARAIGRAVWQAESIGTLRSLAAQH
jgi:L-aminopeptidase/D-esterase-like protein